MNNDNARFSRRDALRMALGEYLNDNLGAARGALPDASTRQKMVALVSGA